MKLDRNLKKIIGTAALLTLSYFCGRGTAQVLDQSGLLPAAGSAGGSWGLSFQEDGKPPIANATAAELKKYDAYYAGSQKKKVSSM